MSILGTRCQLRYVIVFERIAVWGQFGSMLCSVCVLGFPVLFGDASVNKWFHDDVVDGFVVDGCEFTGEHSVGYGATKIVKYSGRV